MKIIILTAAIIAAVASSPLTQEQTWPWQVGKVYNYVVESYTSTKFDYGKHATTNINAKLIISVKAPGQLQARLEDPKHELMDPLVPNDKVNHIPDLNQTFDIFVDSGRIVSMNLPSSLSIVHENIIKSFISALQVDVSSFGHVLDYPNTFDKESFQGLFKKMEYDLIGECETLYSVSPSPSEWYSELSHFSSEEKPIDIFKTKNYGSCTKHRGYAFGVPEGAVWQGVPRGGEEKHFIGHTSNARIIVGKQGTIYKAEVLNTVYVSPMIYGQQKAEVKARVAAYLQSVEQDNSSEWQKCKDFRSVDSLLYTMDNSWGLFTYGAEQNVAKAQKIMQDISPMLQNPEHLQKYDFLMQFNILVYLLFFMNSQQLSQLTSSIEIAKTSKNVAKNGMWIVYRDALAQSGNARAFEEIKSWIITKKIEGDEAALVISAIGSTISQPSKAVLTDFFNLATSTEVLNQKFLNNSALLAVSKLLRSSKEDQFIEETVIPRFSKELKQAIENGESSKAQVYVVVLGNLAHPSILKVFAPYLEGEVTVSKYLRTQMVTSLKTLANLKDKNVRSVLYSIIKNTAETYEVRVAAALNIFMAGPTSEMMQVMAIMSNDDPSTQVSAVLSTSIRFAAGLKDPRFIQLAKTAQSVLYLLPKQKYGYSYSTDSLIDGYTDDDEFSFFSELSSIASEDSLLPKYLRAALRFKGTAFGDESQVTLSVSDILDFLWNRNLMAFSDAPNYTYKYSAKKILELLNTKQTNPEPLEGAIFIEYANLQKLITFNEADVFAFIKNFYGSKQDISSRYRFGINYTKILRHKLVILNFPLASGLPFTYQYSEPMIFNTQGEVKFTVDNLPLSGSFETKMNLTYARNIVGTVGFMDTIGEVLVSTGVINKLQIHLPGSITTSYRVGGDFSMKIQPLHSENDINLVQMNVVPYVGTQKKDSITYSLNVIERTQKDLVTKDKFSLWSEMLFKSEVRSYSSDYKNVDKTFNKDFLTNLGSTLYQKDIAFTEYSLKYLKESTAKSVTFNVFYEKLYNQKNAGEMGAATLTEHIEPNSPLRRAEIAKKVSTGIESAEVTLVDIRAVFDGPNKVNFVFTGAYANSFVDPKFQAAFIARGKEQISAVFKLNKEGAKVVPLNFKEALENKFKVTYDADIKIGQNRSLQVQGFAERSDKYTELLKNSDLGENCLLYLKSNTLYEKECYDVIIKAHAPDYFKATVSYNGDMSYWDLYVVESIYKYLKSEYSFEEDFNFSVKSDKNKVDIEAQAFYFDNYYNYKFTTEYGALSVNNVEGMRFEPYAMAIYAPITSFERASNFYTGYQYMPYCSVDGRWMRTFSDRSYIYKLTSSWHVVMVDSNPLTDLVILARRPADNEEEVYVSYKAETGKYVELEIKPSKVDVKTDGVKTSEGALTTYWDDTKHLEAPLLEYYTLADGIQVFNLRDRHVRIVYDKNRLVIFSDEHRGSTRGLCGQSSSQIADDFMTPFGRVGGEGGWYGASFSLEDEFSDPETVALKKEAKEKSFQPITKFTKILKSDADWLKIRNKTV